MASYAAALALGAELAGASLAADGAVDGAFDDVEAEHAANTIAKDAAMTAYFGNDLWDRDMLVTPPLYLVSRAVDPPLAGS
jgi:hypothetical protein